MHDIQKMFLTMLKRFSLFFILSILIIGCQSNSILESVSPSRTIFSDRNQTISSTITPKIVLTLPISTITPISTVTPYLTKVPTTELNITETPYILSNAIDIKATGNLWIYDVIRSIYWVIDMTTGIVTKTSSPPANCFYTPIFDTLKIICLGTQNLYLYDLSNHNIQDLSIRNPNRLYVPPWVLNNKYLVYGYWSDDLQEVNIYSYDFSTKQEILISMNNQDSEYYISSDGKQVVTVIDNRIIDILPHNTLDLTPLGYDNLIYNSYAIIWSPVGNLLFVGAGDHNVNPFPETNNYFVVNTDTGIANKFSLPTGELRNSSLGAYWSPDGGQIAFGGGLALCVLNVTELDGECIESIEEPGRYVAAIAWSPDSRFIAFFGSDTIFIYDTKLQQHYILLKDIFSTEIFWR